ncbi:MAG TPA: CrcB family protein [Propionibacteriaceae bacterium]
MNRGTLTTAHPSKRAHLSWDNLVLVGLGGTVGTGLRYLISTVVPDWAQMPVATFGINVLGAFLLGVLLELLADRSLDTGWSRRIRLGIGTGLLGGFTTYSALTTETVVLAAAHPAMAAAYAMATVVLGGAASIAGIWLSRGRLRPTLIDAVTRR